MQNTHNVISDVARRIEREKAIAALEKAKKIPRKVVFLPKGASRDFKPKNKSLI